MNALNGIPVIVDSSACNSKYIGPNRRHRNNRIAKKWLKRYGVKYSKCTGVCYELMQPAVVRDMYFNIAATIGQNRTLVFCPCSYNQIKGVMNDSSTLARESIGRS